MFMWLMCAKMNGAPSDICSHSIAIIIDIIDIPVKKYITIIIRLLSVRKVFLGQAM